MGAFELDFDGVTTFLAGLRCRLTHRPCRFVFGLCLIILQPPPAPVVAPTVSGQRTAENR